MVSGPSTTWCACSGWPSLRCPSTSGCSARWAWSTCATRDGRRLYRLNGQALKPIHDWVKNYERSWSERFDLMDVVLEDLKQKEEGDGHDEQRHGDGDAPHG